MLSEYLTTRENNFLVKSKKNEKLIAYFRPDGELIRWADEEEWNWANDVWDSPMFVKDFDFPEMKSYRKGILAESKAKLVGEIAKMCNCNVMLQDITNAVNSFEEEELIGNEVNVKLISNPQEFAEAITFDDYLCGNYYNGTRFAERSKVLFKTPDVKTGINKNHDWGDAAGRSCNEEEKITPDFQLKSQAIIAARRRNEDETNVNYHPFVIIYNPLDKIG
ncbi:hypothetical protein DMA11_10355 [Marinilabiliaceae bacterium JC017]|nr:hypothetical protein DMA11_10355 [Marinilabiliaceae bacterium JC017]